MMLVHGDIDNNVHPGNTMRVVDALIRANLNPTLKHEGTESNFQ